MDAILLIAALVVIAATSPRFGRDRRDDPRSAEHDLASRGVTWEDSTDDLELAARPRASRQRRPRTVRQGAISS